MPRHKLTVALLLVAAPLACKSQPGPQLKGLTIDETTKDIDYEALLAGKSTLTFTSLVAFESSYKSPRPDASAAKDQGTDAAYDQVSWLRDKAGPDVFGGKLTVEVDDFQTPASEVVMNKIYRFAAVAKGVEISYPRAGGDIAKAVVDVRLQVVLGAAMGPSRRGGLAMPDAFRTLLAETLVRDDVVSYNGHIWTTEDAYPATPWSPAPVDDTTLALRDEMKALGGRTSYGVIYMNACRGEQIERAVMAGLLGNEKAPVEPLLLSHRNFSNYGFFAQHNGDLLQNLLHGRSLARVVLDLTTSLPPAQRGTHADADGPNEAEATKILADYYQRPGVMRDPNAVVVVAYDVVDGRPVSKLFQ